MKWVLIGFFRFWRRFVSVSYQPVCKYYPSCSSYALEAVRCHGAVGGTALAVWRIVRCNPWSRGGYDPVPATEAAYLWELEQAGLWVAGDGVRP